MKGIKKVGDMGLSTLLVFLGSTTALTAYSASVTQSKLDAAAGDSVNFLMPNANYESTRYYPSKVLTQNNVKNLTKAWSFRTGVPAGFSNSPIIANGVMYISTAFNQVIALNINPNATTRERWRYIHQQGPVTTYCCGPNNRGLAILGNTLYMATLDSRLVALNADTGAVIFSKEIADPNLGYSGGGAPIAVDGKVLIGTQGGEFGIRGFVKAFDATTGDLLWTFHTIPSSREESAGSLLQGTFKTTDITGRNMHRNYSEEIANFNSGLPDINILGGGVWQSVTVDRSTSTVYFMVGNPSPDLNGLIRPGDNLYTNSLVAVDLNTGALKCHNQYIPHDVWDLDAASTPVIAQVKTASGQTVKGILHGNKLGYVMVHRADDCSLIRVSQPMISQTNRWVLPVETDDPSLGAPMLPGANGGVEWSPIAIDPDRKLAFAANLSQPMYYSFQQTPFPGGNHLWLGGSFSVIPATDAIPIFGPVDGKEFGRIAAVNYNTGAIQWQVDVPEPLVGGVLATAGGLVFVGGLGQLNSDGTLSPNRNKGWIGAFSSDTGKRLFTYGTNAGVNAPPVSFTVGGEQFIAVAAGGSAHLNTPTLSDELIVFKLP